MTAVGSAWQFYSFLEDLAHSESSRVLRRALDRRWPDSPDRLDALARHALTPPGKMLRPLMMLHVAEAVGGTPAALVAAALGLEYLHAATLVHDDIIDGDELRRGKPSAQAAFGAPDAIIGGDYLIFHAFLALLDEPWSATPARVAAACAALAEAGCDLCRGQMMEEQIVGDLQGGAGRYPEMIRLKTAALFRAVCLIGAQLGGAETDVATGLGRYGEHVGVAFQIRDDLLSYVATAEQTGKSVAGDLRNGRPTLPLMLALESATATQRADLLAVFARRGSADGDLDLVTALLERTGAVDAARREMAGHAAQARRELASLAPSPSAAVLGGVTDWLSSGGV